VRSLEINWRRSSALFLGNFISSDSSPLDESSLPEEEDSSLTSSHLVLRP
jgi:hypothetical protein